MIHRHGSAKLFCMEYMVEIQSLVSVFSVSFILTSLLYLVLQILRALLLTGSQLL